MSTVTKVLRSTRLVRLLRVARLSTALEKLSEAVRSEAFHVSVRIGILVLLGLGVVHCLACCWYALGLRMCSVAMGDCWVVDHGLLLEQSTSNERYVMSFHWAMTQFIGNMKVEPTNFWERAFAASVLVFTFLASSVFLSGITSLGTQLVLIRNQQASQLASLKRYLKQCSVSRRLVARAVCSARLVLQRRLTRTVQADVKLLDLIPKPMRAEIHYQAHAHILAVHPFFRRYNHENPPAVSALCDRAVSILWVEEEDLLFTEGDVSGRPKMFFVVGGELKYTRAQKRFEPILVAGAWASEMALWTNWVDHGTMISE